MSIQIPAEFHPFMYTFLVIGIDVNLHRLNKLRYNEKASLSGSVFGVLRFLLYLSNISDRILS